MGADGDNHTPTYDGPDSYLALPKEVRAHIEAESRARLLAMYEAGLVGTLLKLAEVRDTETARARLCGYLDFYRQYWVETVVEGLRVPKEDCERVIRAAQDLLHWMRVLDRQFQGHWTRVTGCPPRDFQHGWLGPKDSDDVKAAVTRALTEAEILANDRRVAQPAKLSKLVAVEGAVRYLYTHFPSLQATVRLSAKHDRFVVLFYETVTGEPATRRELEHQIRIMWRRLNSASRGEG